jgi:hypothetical protein
MMHETAVNRIMCRLDIVHDNIKDCPGILAENRRFQMIDAGSAHAAPAWAEHVANQGNATQN